MKILKVIYDNDTKFILDVVNNLTTKVYIEVYNYSHYKEKKRALPIMTRHGTGNVPLLVFENENLEEYAAIWSESKPDWAKEIYKILVHG